MGAELGQDSKKEASLLAIERTHNLSGTVNSVSGIEAFCGVPNEPPHFEQIGQQNSGGIHKYKVAHVLLSFTVWHKN